MKRFFTLFYLGLCWSGIKAQTNIDFGMTAGLALYQGDLSADALAFSPEDLGPAGSVFLRFQFKKWLSLRTGVHYAALNADDRRSGRTDRRLHFQSNTFEPYSLIEIAPAHVRYFDSRAVLVPYVTAGVGLLSFNPKTLLRGELIELRPVGTEGQGLANYNDYYSKSTLSIPLGLGLRFVVNDRLSIGLEIMGRILQTDYLDDVSGVLVRYGDILDNKGASAAQLSNPLLPLYSDPNLTYQRGDFDKDTFFSSSISFAWRIQQGDVVYQPGKSNVLCPRF